MTRIKHHLTTVLISLMLLPGARATNPLLPGYFADPTVKKFGDTYYIYATTDGIKLASGEPQVWISNDFVNWTNTRIELHVPAGLNNCWAPDVHQVNGKYYYFMGNCEMGCNIYGYVSDSPLGPFKPINSGKPVIPAGTAKENLPALDAQYFVDDDGAVYAYFGTWCTSFGGMGVAKIDPKDMSTILHTSFIPIAQIPGAFEAAYPLKRHGKYFLMYSSGDCRLSSYAVHYSVSDNPEGPFVPGKNSPILVSSPDGVIDGPGHHSVLQEGDNYYIVYHRHDNPHSTNGEFRQVCADKLIFSDDQTIEKVLPGSTGIGYLGTNTISATDWAHKAATGSSSAYHLKAMPTAYSKTGYDYRYKPENAVDHDYGTMWKAASAHLPQSLTIDLGKTIDVRRIATCFEYPTWYYCYHIEVSTDNKKWTVFADRTSNRTCGSPMVDDNALAAHYIRLTITGTEKQGVIPAIWDIRVYDKLFTMTPITDKPSSTAPAVAAGTQLLVDFDASNYSNGKIAAKSPNRGALKGFFVPKGKPVIAEIDGQKALKLDGESFLQVSVKAPKTLAWNSAYTVSMWVKNPEIGMGECLLCWTSRANMLQSSYAAVMYGKSNFGAVAHGDGAVDLPFRQIPSAGQWHHVVVTFDGALETVYVDGTVDTQQPLSLYVENGEILIGASGEPSENFSGFIRKAQLYNYALTAAEVKTLFLNNSTKGMKK